MLNLTTFTANACAVAKRRSRLCRVQSIFLSCSGLLKNYEKVLTKLCGDVAKCGAVEKVVRNGGV